MKKYFTILLAGVLCAVLLTACGGNVVDDQAEVQQPSVPEHEFIPEPDWEVSIPEFPEGDELPLVCSLFGTPLFEFWMYYDAVPVDFVDYAIEHFGEDRVDDFHLQNQLMQEDYIELEFGMTMANFIREFNISRKTFDRLNAEFEESFWGDELPVLRFNADIIFSFDNELINEYYRTSMWIMAHRLWDEGIYYAQLPREESVAIYEQVEQERKELQEELVVQAQEILAAR
ncbi:MAG: hypothetical protein FWE06_03350 [Oscillospiraceae bacterium]|nr:hypothetical protein [Oscillospiraceae bacterium]